MNYITQLKSQISEQQQVIARYEEMVADLHRYLLSAKFRCGDPLDGYVNVSDVLRRTEVVL